ncbi:MAG TPA: carbohydrate ABC transporter permease [Chloroflexi bacterium]|nr:carbohydrate ABC transporter permease [Chloroflexota bacterium]
MKKLLAKIPIHIIVITIAMAWMTPSVGVFINSLRSPQAIKSTGWWTVFRTPFDFTQWTLENYVTVLEAQGLARSFRNSLLISIPATILPILVAAFAAYAFAWMQFRGRQVLFSIVVGLLVVPLQMTFVPIYSVFTRLGLNGTFIAIWAAHTGYGLPFAVYLLRNFFGSLPKDLFESAYLDGASPFTAFTQLALPLSLPSLASLAIFQFLWVWNDLLVALIYLGGTPAVAPLTVRVAGLVDSLGADWHLLPAAAFISMLLPMIVFFSMQQYFVRGILAGSVKG